MIHHINSLKNDPQDDIDENKQKNNVNFENAYMTILIPDLSKYFLESKKSEEFFMRGSSEEFNNFFRLYDFKGKKLLKNLSILPLVVPDIIIGVSLLIMFATVKFKLGITTIFIAHTTFNIPYVLFIILSRLEEFDYSVVEAAHDLGATNRQTLTKVIIPLLL